MPLSYRLVLSMKDAAFTLYYDALNDASFELQQVHDQVLNNKLVQVHTKNDDLAFVFRADDFVRGEVQAVDNEDYVVDVPQTRLGEINVGSIQDAAELPF